MIEAVGVVVPAHDEEENLTECLQALDRAGRALPADIELFTVVVLDACTDASARIAQRWTARHPEARMHLSVPYRNVGRARAAGINHALTALSSHRLDRVWLATTDADSLVPEHWLREQLRMAAGGVEAIAGSIRVRDWSEYPEHIERRFERFYAPPGSTDAHVHVHGANLGVRADAYLASGGFEPLATGEDHALWRALHRAARSRVSSRRLAVTTSARRHARAPEGFSGFLAAFVADR